MRAYTSMTTRDFVSQLREIACKANASSSIIYQLDRIIDVPTEDELAEELEEACGKEYDHGFVEGKVEGERNLEQAEDEAAKSIYNDAVAAIEALAHADPSEIGLTETQIYQLVNHVLWNVRP